MADDKTWSQFEDTVSDAVWQSLATTLDNSEASSFYAAAFHLFYAEEDGEIDLPCLALNSVATRKASPDETWSPADWDYVEIDYETAQVKKHHRAIVKDAGGGDIEHWHTSFTAFMNVFVRVAKTVSKKLRSHSKTASDFDVFVLHEDSEEADQWLLASTSEKQFKKLFPNRWQEMVDRKSLEHGSTAQKLAYYAKNLFEYGPNVLELGSTSVPMLLDALKDSDDGWLAADLLGRLGVRSSNVIHALRRYAHRSFHETGALIRLGDFDYVLALVEREHTREQAIEGIKTLYGDSTLPLDYGPIERLLQLTPYRRAIETPWSSVVPFHFCLTFRTIGADDLDEALRGLKARHRMIRAHAVACLGDRRVGVKNARRVLDALVGTFSDRSFMVRRLAALQLPHWKKAALPYKKDLRRLTRDANPDVRDAARYSLRELK